MNTGCAQAVDLRWLKPPDIENYYTIYSIVLKPYFAACTYVFFYRLNNINPRFIFWLNIFMQCIYYVQFQLLFRNIRNVELNVCSRGVAFLKNRWGRYKYSLSMTSWLSICSDISSLYPLFHRYPFQDT